MPPPPPDPELPDLSELSSPDARIRNSAWEAADKLLRPRLEAYFAAKEVDPESCRDIAQQVLKEQIAQVLDGKLAKQADVWPRLFTIAHCRFLNHLRYGRRHPHDTWAEPPEPPLSLAALPDHESLKRCLEKLPAPLMELVNLHYWEDLKQTEIAVQKKRPEGTVNYQIDKAKKLIKVCLEASRATP